jgi:hypothetical protein
MVTSRMTQRTKWIGLAYALVMVLPLVASALLNRQEIATWLSSGLCPGGPMDRPAAPCGPVDIMFIVFLGGWAVFIVLPLLIVWWTAATAAFFLARRRNRQR